LDENLEQDLLGAGFWGRHTEIASTRSIGAYGVTILVVDMSRLTCYGGMVACTCILLVTFVLGVDLGVQYDYKATNLQRAI
jgi:hypothetical protein